jgi:cytochrome c oxidase assembly factor CtaG
VSLRAIALDWSVDGTFGGAFLVAVVLVGLVYVRAAARGRRLDRRGRRWPRARTACFLGGLVVLVLDLYSGIGTEADTRLSVHMLEHMVMWVVVAPLLVAGAPVRLALYSLPRNGRRRLARCLRSRAAAALTGPVGSVSLFSAVLVITHLPALYGAALTSEYVHAAEHCLYLIAAMLVWAPIIGVDPLPHRAGPRARIACMLACMVPMVLIAAWLGGTSHAIYGRYLQVLGPSALGDQRLAAIIMVVGGLPAFAIPALRRLGLPQRQPLRPIQSPRAAA